MRVKRSIAVLIRDGARILALRRPDDDDELPGVWGLPAGSFREEESLDQLIERIGRDKLGVKLNALGKIAEGTQDRPAYRLVMELWEVSMEGAPTRGRWQWSSIDILRPGEGAGSMCCALALKATERENT
jgi:ADP-ribose pyrophosphatase YjhB (NUDIX family)